MTAISSPNCRWHVGEVEITRVLEFEAALFEPAVIHPEASPEIIARHRTWLEPTLMDPASGLLVFAYHLHPSVRLPDDTPDLFACRGRRYLFRAVDIAAYRERMRVRSPRWRTVSLPLADFRLLVRPLREGLHGSPARAHRQGRPGRATLDHPDRLPQGLLPRLLLDHAQVPP